jgi:hypothetical protein
MQRNLVHWFDMWFFSTREDEKLSLLELARLGNCFAEAYINLHKKNSRVGGIILITAMFRYIRNIRDLSYIIRSTPVAITETTSGDLFLRLLHTRLRIYHLGNLQI